VSGGQAAPPPVTYRLYPTTNGPASVTGYSGNFVVGVCFTVTAPVSLKSYWYWATANGDTTAVKCCCWHMTGSQSGLVLAGSTVTSGALTLGTWNQIALSPAVPLTVGASYIGALGWVVTHGFSLTAAQFGAGDPYSAGIVNGPLTGYSDQSGSNPPPIGFDMFQYCFTTGTSDPTAGVPPSQSNSFNGWVDISVG
jgi:hypothetical protein